MDQMQRKILTKEEADSIYLTTTDVLEILNKTKKNDITPKDIEINLKEMKRQQVEEKSLENSDEFDIFGGIIQDSTKVSKIKNHKHREIQKDKFNILEINKNTNQLGYKLALEKVVNNIIKALDKVVVPEDLPVYKAIGGEELDNEKINLFNINPEKEMKEILKNDTNSKINFYKINLKEGTNAISYTNGIFYDNQNKTLPIGQDLSTKILIDTSKMKLKLQNKKSFKMVQFDDNNNDFSDIRIKDIDLLEYNLIENEKDMS